MRMGSSLLGEHPVNELVGQWALHSERHRPVQRDDAAFIAVFSLSVAHYPSCLLW